jgi:hypothetical protein
MRKNLPLLGLTAFAFVLLLLGFRGISNAFRKAAAQARERRMVGQVVNDPTAFRPTMCGDKFRLEVKLLDGWHPLGTERYNTVEEVCALRDRYVVDGFSVAGFLPPDQGVWTNVPPVLGCDERQLVMSVPFPTNGQHVVTNNILK